MSKNNLLLAWCSYDAAKHAVTYWHYSHQMPAGKLVKIGVWENGEFIGAVIYGRGANNNIGSPYGLLQTEICELVRVALRKHHSPVSKIVAVSLRMLRKNSPGLKMVISFADPKQGHTGMIYQAMNWTYLGHSQAQCELIIGGKFTHKRSATAQYGTASIKEIKKITNLSVKNSPKAFKLTYAMPLDAEIRRELLKKKIPYPKSVPSIDGDAPDDQSGEGGSSPTGTLHISG